MQTDPSSSSFIREYVRGWGVGLSRRTWRTSHRTFPLHSPSCGLPPATCLPVAFIMRGRCVTSRIRAISSEISPHYSYSRIKETQIKSSMLQKKSSISRRSTPARWTARLARSHRIFFSNDKMESTMKVAIYTDDAHGGNEQMRCPQSKASIEGRKSWRVTLRD